MKKRIFSYSAIDNFIMEKHPQGSRTVVCQIAEGANEIANKKLISAAPEMLDALYAIQNELETHAKYEHDWTSSELHLDTIDLLNKAIAKAKGQK